MTTREPHHDWTGPTAISFVLTWLAIAVGFAVLPGRYAPAALLVPFVSLVTYTFGRLELEDVRAERRRKASAEQAGCGTDEHREA